MTKQELANLLEKWINELRLEEYGTKTLVSYKQEMLIFIDWYIEGKEINKDLLIDYKNFLKNKFNSSSTINKYITITNKFMRFIMPDFYTSLRLKKIKVQQTTSIDDPIFEQEHKRLLRWAKKLELEDMYLIMKIFALAGARVEELKIFKVENLDNYMKVYNKGKERYLILRNDLLRELKKYCKDNKIKSGYIFRSPKYPNDPNKMIHTTTIWRRLKKIARAAKINSKKIHPHAWRHLFSKGFMEVSGNKIEELADILGHSNIETTRLYTKTSKMEKKKTLEKLKF